MVKAHASNFLGIVYRLIMIITLFLKKYFVPGYDYAAHKNTFASKHKNNKELAG
jgi:hypothetical protein